jgi:hypothetical protein
VRCLLGPGRGRGFFRAGFPRSWPRDLRCRTLAFDVRFPTLSLDCDTVLLAHEPVAIGRKREGRNLEFAAGEQCEKR